ncbi:MAG TPA: phosphoribosyltransferase [Pseudonocardiaceae bacterium]
MDEGGAVFVDRVDAGRQLGQRLQHLRGPEVATGVVVLGLPRGGVRVAAEVAAALDAPLDVIVVRKLGVPSQPELAMGAIGEGGVRLLQPETIRRSGVTPEALAAVVDREQAELTRRAGLFRGDRTPVPLTGRVAQIVGDGIATGSSARAACLVARAQGAVRVVLAVPVAPFGWVHGLHDVADELIALITPRQLQAIGMWYSDFSQSSDEEVIACLRSAVGR